MMFARLSSTEGFWKEDLPVSNPPEVFEQRIDGQLYHGAIIQKILLYPTRTGELEIGPMELTCEVRERTSGRRRFGSLFDSVFDDPFFGGFQTRSVDIESEPVTVSVRSLPSEGRPAGFQEVVGRYRIRAELDQDSVATNESVTLTVRISGTGNIGFIPEPELNIPPDLEIYDPQTRQDQESTGRTLEGWKSFTYLLIPRRAGVQRIAPIEFSFFDPDRRRYSTVETDELVLNVRPASGWDAMISDLPGGSAEEVRSLATDIRWIHDSSVGLRRSGPPLYQQATYPIAYLLPALIALGALLARRRMDQLAGNVAAARSRKATKRALSALKEANQAYKAGNITQGYDALARGLVYYIADRAHTPAADLAIDRIAEILSGRGVSTDQIAEIRELIHRCNTARFTPDGMDEHALSDLIGQARKWILGVDRYFEKKQKSR